MISTRKSFNRRAGTLLLAGTMLGGWAVPLMAQAAPTASAPAAATAPAAPAERKIRSILVRGNQRLEPETIRAYAGLAPGQTYTTETLDTALKTLYASQLFADVTISGAPTGDLVIAVRENPVINRIILEGNKRLKDDKILPEIKLAPRQIFTRSAARADVERILELYRRQGRFGARVDPKIVQLDQNRVDVVLEIVEGDVAKIRAINILGNDHFKDGRLRKQMYTHESGGILGFLKSNDSYDPDRLAADQQKLRSFYLTEGYADFRVVSALAELTPDRRDFVITYVVEEGPRYRFGTVEAESALRDLPSATVLKIANLHQGQWFNAKAVEDSVTALNEVAGNLGYAFADFNPSYDRDATKHVMKVTLRAGATPRVYVERIDIAGNTSTRDKVIRREFRLNEGDAFSAARVKRSQDRIQSLGYFGDKLEVKQSDGSAPDKIVLGLDVEEKPTGQLSFSGGYSSLERFVIQLSVSQNNFMGKGQQLQASINYSAYSKSIEAGWADPYFLDKPILFGAQVFRRDMNSFNYLASGERNTTYSQLSTGGVLRMGFPVTEYWNFGGRYGLVKDKVTLDRNTFYTNGVCDPLKAGRYLCDELGGRLTSSLSYSASFSNTNGIHPTRGQNFVLSQDFAGLGGDVRYIRTRVDATKYKSIGAGWVASVHGEGGYIAPLQSSAGPGRDAIRLTDRFFGPQLRGFDIRGIGPRVERVPYDLTGVLSTDVSQVADSLGGRAYYMGRLELEVPASGTLRSLGMRPSIYLDVGSLWGLTRPILTNVIATCIPLAANTTGTAFQITPDNLHGNTCGPTEGTGGFSRIAGYKEIFEGNSPKPRVSIGVGVNWTSPFGPLRLDLAKAIVKQRGDETKLFSFNVGTSF
ncbi:MAG: outer membrane protein assembly factor BamA [Sphingomicrobium sp.]